MVKWAEIAIVDGKMSENHLLLPESDAITPENHTKTSLNDVLMVKYNEITTLNDEKSASGKIWINFITIGISLWV